VGDWQEDQRDKGARGVGIEYDDHCGGDAAGGRSIVIIRK
jgi:hypothetical protein